MNRCLEFHTVIKPTVFQSCVLTRFSLIEVILIAQQDSKYVCWSSTTIAIKENEFIKSNHLYNSALKNSGFNYSKKFEAPVENTRPNSNRKILWFNPLYSLNVKTNSGKVFLKLVRKHFPRSHKFKKIFNFNTVKTGYSSMPIVKNLIKQHNSKILSKE